MDEKIFFLNVDLERGCLYGLTKGFQIKGKDQIVSKLKKSTYGLKQASQKWYINFNDTITSFGF